MKNDDENGKEKQDNYKYTLPDYSRLLAFPNFKSKLHKKLKIKRDSLIHKKSLEENSKNPCIEFVNFLEAEINLIQFLLDNKEIKDDI